MALTGTLADIGIVDLIQFPNKSRKTGELTISYEQNKAQLYYKEGSLVHAAAGNLYGIDALVELVSWTEGNFEFLVDVVNDVQTLDIDFHRALMTALKIRDEMLEELRKKQCVVEVVKTESSRIGNIIDAVLSQTPCLHGVGILSSDGSVKGEVESDDEKTKGSFSRILESVALLYVKCKMENLSRIFLENKISVVHACRLSSGDISVIAAGRETSLGQLSLMMNRLTSVLEECER